jgi:hypothetical protein
VRGKNELARETIEVDAGCRMLRVVPSVVGSDGGALALFLLPNAFRSQHSVLVFPRGDPVAYAFVL